MVSCGVEKESILLDPVDIHGICHGMMYMQASYKTALLGHCDGNLGHFQSIILTLIITSLFTKSKNIFSLLLLFDGSSILLDSKEQRNVGIGIIFNVCICCFKPF